MAILNKDGRIKININGYEDEAILEVTEYDVTLQFKTVEKADNLNGKKIILVE